MNQNTAGAVLLLVLAAAGLVYGTPVAVALVAVTAALAFLAEDCRDAGKNGCGVQYLLVGFGMAVLSWITTAAAAVSLII